MQIRKNKLKQIFATGKRSFGLWNGINDSYAAEICAGAGFDWVLIDGEHAPFDLRSILVQMQAMSYHESAIMVRPPSDNPVFLKQLMDAGVQSFLVPMVETAEQARNIVSAITYPPNGKRGIGSALSRAAQWKRVGNYFAEADKEMCLVLQIESVEGMANIEEIAAVDGVDGVFIGPADLAGSMGLLGQPMHDDVRAEVKRGIKIIRKHGKNAGALAVRDDVIQEYLDAGAQMIGLGVDLILLAKATENMARSAKEKFGN